MRIKFSRLALCLTSPSLVDEFEQLPIDFYCVVYVIVMFKILTCLKSILKSRDCDDAKNNKGYTN